MGKNRLGEDQNMNVSRREFVGAAGALAAASTLAGPASAAGSKIGRHGWSTAYGVTVPSDKMALIEETHDFRELGTFDFGLSGDQEKRATELHNESIIIDLAFQHPGGYRLFEREPFKSRAEELRETASGLDLIDPVNFELPYKLDPELMRAFWDLTGVTAGHADLFMDMSRIDKPQIHLELAEWVPWLRLVRTADDIRQAQDAGEHALIGYSQPVYGFDRNIGNIEEVYERGMRSLLLTYNNTNACGCGSMERLDHGLTNFGIEVVQKCNELGILLDTSHNGVQTTFDVCKFSRQPVTANHTNARALFEHRRCKTDDQIRAIADTGGLIGITTVPFFLAKDPREASISHVLDHIDHVAKLVGWQHLGIGSDWPHTLPKSILLEVFSPASLKKLGGASAGAGDDYSSYLVNVKGFDDYIEYRNITRGLVSRAYTDQQIRGILGENYLRIFEQVCG